MPLNALVKRSTTGVTPYGSRTEVPFGCGSVSAQTIFAGVDRASGLPSYAVRISNNTQHALRAQVRFGSFDAASDVEIAPFSIIDTLLCAPRAAAKERAVVRVQGSGLTFTLDARPPVAAARRVAKLLAGLTLLLAFCIAVVSGVWAYAGTARVPTRIAAVPAPRVITRTRVITRHEPAKPLLDDLDVTPSAVSAGGNVRVRYGAYGDGTVWLLDEHGRVWAKHRIVPSGETAFAIPESAAGQSLRVVLTAQRGAQHAQMSAGILVLPDGTNLAEAEPQTPQSPVVSPESLASGNAIHVRLPDAHGEALLSVTDTSGSIIEEVDVPTSQTSAVLHAPSVSAPTTYDVVVSIANGHAQSQTIKAITVVP